MTEAVRNHKVGTTANGEDGQLELELQQFCRRLAHFAPDFKMREAYRRANALVFAQAAGEEYEAQKKVLRKALAAKRDLEALEYAWRLVRHDNILTKKMHVFLYLLETSPAHYERFVNEKKKRATAYLILGLQVVRSAFKLCRGYFSLITLRVGI